MTKGARGLLEGFLVQLDPVGDAASHGTDVNKVEAAVWECPFLVDIVHFEFAVGRNKAGLDGREVDAEDISGRMLVGELTTQDLSQLSEGWVWWVTHIAQIPVPQPTSRTRCISSQGLSASIKELVRT